MGVNEGERKQALSGATPWEAEAIAVYLLKCGAMALRQRETGRYSLKSDGSLVTAADRLVESLLSDMLPQPGDFFIGEETIGARGDAYARDALLGRCWVVDPIDGTSSFAHGFPLWGISVGYMDNGVLRDGAVIVPECGVLLVTDGPRVRHYRFANLDEALPAGWCELPVPAGAWQAGGVLMLGQQFCKNGVLRLPNPVVASGSAVQALTAVLTGQAQAYLGHMKLWDIAGILPMMARLGISGRLADGGEISDDVQSGGFVLDTRASTCWALRDNCVITAERWQHELKGVVTWKASGKDS